MINLNTPSFLIISTLLIGGVNIIAPYVTKEDTKIRSFLLISISIFFLVNVLILDYLFIKGTEINFTLLYLGKYSIALGLESLGLIFLTLLAFLWVPALLYTIKFLAINDFKKSGRYLLFVNISVLSACFVALSWNLITMFIGYELITLSTIPLIIHIPGHKNLKGLFKYLKILMITSLLFLLPAIVVIYSKIGTGTFALGGFIGNHFSNEASICLLLAFIFGISKAAIYPFHGWLPAAMVASYPVSALLHAVVVVKTGLFCMYKILVYVFGLKYLQELFIDYNWIVFLPAITIFYSAVAALRTKEIKMILAYSTINQLSLALISAFLFTPKGIIAALMHMTAHAFTKICMFYSAGNFYSLTGARYINQLSYLSKTMPITSLVMLISSLSLIGIPPFGGFISKFYIMIAAAEGYNFFVMAVVATSTVLSSVYVVKILTYIYKNGDADNVNYVEEKLPIFIFISLTICLSGVIGFFFVGQIINVFLTFL